MKEIDSKQEQEIDFSVLGRNIREMVDNVFQTITAAREVLLDKISSISNLRIDLSPVAEILRQVMEGTERLADVAQRFSLIMLEAGWPPLSAFDLYPSEMVSIVNQYDKDVTSIQIKVEEFVISKFGDKEIKSLLGQWTRRDWLKKRLPILQEVIEAHIEGKYFVAIAGLLPQIEGVIAEGYGHSGIFKEAHYKRYAEKLLKNRDKCSFDQAAEDFLFNVILIGFEHGKELGSFLSRHAILHGADVGYGIKTNSLKCILLFDYLQNRFGVVSVGKRKIYHSLGCRIVKNKGRGRQVYETREAAEKEGKQPCKVCKP